MFKYPFDKPYNQPDCGVVAVAFVAGTTYREARAAVAAHRDTGDHPSWKGRTWLGERIGALLDLGVPVRRRAEFEGMTLNQARRTPDLLVGSFVLTASRHVFVAHVGAVYDNQYGDGHLTVDQYFKQRRSLVRSCFEVGIGPVLPLDEALSGLDFREV